jgi:hypothetical protein
LSTWHQQKAGIPPLYHPTLYTVVCDPPNELLTVSRFADPVQAERLKENLQRAWVGDKVQKYPGADGELLDAWRRDAAVRFYTLAPQR